MSSFRIAILLFGLGACMVGEGAPAPGVDAAAPGGSGGSSNNNNESPDAATGSSQSAACTGAAYDPCTDSTQCTGGDCKAFGGAGLEVCTVACTPGDNTTCPTEGGITATCNNMGLCKPTAATACSR